MTSVRNGDTGPVRFLFATLLTYESEFYGRVAAGLASRGHEVAFVTESGDSARLLRGRGFTVDLLAEFDPALEGYQAAAFISLRADSCEEFGYGGFKSTYPHLRTVIREQDMRLDQCVQAKYGELTGLEFLPDNITPNMTEYHAFQRISRTTPANILELGFLSHDRDLLQNHTDVMAQAIVNGLMCFLNPVELATMQAPQAPLPAESVVPAPTGLPGVDVVPTPTLSLP